MLLSFFFLLSNSKNILLIILFFQFRNGFYYTSTSSFAIYQTEGYTAVHHHATWFKTTGILSSSTLRCSFIQKCYKHSGRFHHHCQTSYSLPVSRSSTYGIFRGNQSLVLNMYFFVHNNFYTPIITIEWTVSSCHIVLNKSYKVFSDSASFLFKYSICLHVQSTPDYL